MIPKKWWGWIAIVVLSISPLIPWYFAMQVSFRFFNISTTFTTIGQMLGLVGITMFSLNIFLSLRLKWYEDYFGGMNRVYVAHHLYGGIAFILLLAHPLALATSYLPTSLKDAAMFLLPGKDWENNLGMAALLGMISLLGTTFFIDLPYQLWRLTHKFIGLLFFLASIHGFFIASDISRFNPLKYYMLIFFIGGLAAYTYKTLLGRFLIKKALYEVLSIRQLPAKTVEIKLKAINRNIVFTPGQFVFINFISKGVSDEVHPFSISSIPTDDNLMLTIKSEGDYTTTLSNLTTGDKAYIEGSFGRFNYQKAVFKNQIWIAGGIGITPFLSMARALPTSEYTVDLYYSVRTPEEAVYLEDFTTIAASNKNFRIIPFYTKTQGRLNIQTISTSSQDIIHNDIFICGPPPMMYSLKVQCKKMGIPKKQVHTEEFQML